MTQSRRVSGASRFALLSAAALLAAGAAFAQGYPAKPVRVVVPYAAGGPLDEAMRLVGPRLTEIWAQQVIVDNRAGAGGSIGTEVVVRAAPDGYTLLLGNSGPITVNPGLVRRLAYDPQKDLAPIALMVSAQMVLSVHPSLPVRSVKELAALARANPGRVTFGSIGIGNLTHLGIELLQSKAGVRMNHVPYKGAAPALVDLMAGHIEVLLANIAGTVPYVKSGRVRAIAVSSAKRARVLPEVPAIAETYPGYDLVTWMGLFAPAAAPRPVLTRLQGDVVKVLQRPDVRERFESQGTEVIAGGGEELSALIERETRLYAGIIKSAGITPQ